MDPATESADYQFIIGIDLGTTNCAVSYVDLREAPGPAGRPLPIQTFRVPQLTGPGEVNTLPVLPSFLYLPGTYDLDETAVSLTWRPDDKRFVGAFARDHGAKVPNRLVASAKSWLCHSQVDRRAPILPWGVDNQDTPDLSKVSPVEATALYLEHIKLAWNRWQKGDADCFLENQLIVITVPASFDQVARDLTLAAARQAGLEGVTLLEEPLAAFYSWLRAHSRSWADQVQPGELILICDVGGGTTDLTLITLTATEGTPRFERIAVGDHLILGGDNIDLALARFLEHREGRQKLNLDGDRWKTLCHQCRQAKEQILEGAAESTAITVMGRGRKLIGNTLSIALDRQEMEKVVLDGFFPLVAAEAPRSAASRSGITEFGLPYEPEPAITRQIGWFLEKHRDDIRNQCGGEFRSPDWILFNGGSLKPPSIQSRIQAAVGHWFQEGQAARQPGILPNPQPELAVALGAAYYGLVKIGRGVRVGSGSPRAYFLGLARERAATDAEANPKALCVVERGLDEGSHIVLPQSEFTVRANQPVRFDIYSSSYRAGDRCGDLVGVDDSLTPLPPLATVVQYGRKGVQTRIPVTIEGDYTEIGTLALWCRSKISSHRWQMQFQLRDTPDTRGVPEETILEDEVVKAARNTLSNKLLKINNTKELENITKVLQEVIGHSRDQWPLGLLRHLADDLIQHARVRTTSPVHEARWLNLAGFCLRPGFGDGFDPQRIKKLWKILLKGPLHGRQAQVRTEWWILWRRIAGGLKAGQQRHFFQEVRHVLVGDKAAAGPWKLSAQERLELWMAAANMERLSAKDKTVLGRQLLAELKPKKSRPQHFWALGRMGARELLYGPADRVLTVAEAARWVDTLLAKKWRNLKPVAAALAQLARQTGDRARDLAPEQRRAVLDWLDQDPDLAKLKLPIASITETNKLDQAAIFGESLPAGLVLHA